jgi:TPR repeat protein
MSDHVEKLLHLARINDYEPGSKPNPEKAFQYYKEAAELGSPYAQYCVAACYANGFGVLKDDVEAFGWFLTSALQKPPGFSSAQHAVGVCFRDGKGAPKDHREAVRAAKNVSGSRQHSDHKDTQRPHR